MTAPAPDHTAHPAGRRIAQHVVSAGWVMRPLPAQVPHFAVFTDRADAASVARSFARPGSRILAHASGRP